MRRLGNGNNIGYSALITTSLASRSCGGDMVTYGHLWQLPDHCKKSNFFINLRNRVLKAFWSTAIHNIPTCFLPFPLWRCVPHGFNKQIAYRLRQLLFAASCTLVKIIHVDFAAVSRPRPISGSYPASRRC